ncbi:MAG TPA: LytTR family DNA-binding domain-containing protein [Bacteroidia bacterium]|jgi:two-component system LytT family response regulator|nr:LytTR family DNA-binding domain-containing protein [Bacteroidia bacterium]
MLRAIIIDDEQQGINNIKLLISKFIKNVKVVAETRKALKGIELIEDYRPEIVFLDIKMPHMSGFELLQKLKFKEFSLIFITAHEEFGLQAIKNNALDYLLKPIDIEDLRIAINRAKEKLDKKEILPDLQEFFLELNSGNQNKIHFNTKDRIEYISKNDIIRLESDSNYTYVYSVGGKKLCISKTIGHYEALLCLDDNNFMRVHNSHIVNLNHVTKFIKNPGTIITTENYEVPISQNKRDDFTNWLNIKSYFNS